jgi:hypothetical protein
MTISILKLFLTARSQIGNSSEVSSEIFDFVYTSKVEQ